MPQFPVAAARRKSGVAQGRVKSDITLHDFSHSKCHEMSQTRISNQVLAMSVELEKPSSFHLEKPDSNHHKLTSTKQSA